MMYTVDQGNRTYSVPSNALAPAINLAHSLTTQHHVPAVVRRDGYVWYDVATECGALGLPACDRVSVR